LIIPIEAEKAEAIITPKQQLIAVDVVKEALPEAEVCVASVQLFESKRMELYGTSNKVEGSLMEVSDSTVIYIEITLM
jgi:hypothetical protein